MVPQHNGIWQQILFVLWNLQLSMKLLRALEVGLWNIYYSLKIFNHYEYPLCWISKHLHELLIKKGTQIGYWPPTSILFGLWPDIMHLIGFFKINHIFKLNDWTLMMVFTALNVCFILIKYNHTCGFHTHKRLNWDPCIDTNWDKSLLSWINNFEFWNGNWNFDACS